MKFSKTVILAILALGLAACEPAATIPLNTPVKATYGASVGGGTVTGTKSTEIRSYAKNSEGKNVQVAGANCTLQGNGLSAEFVVPTSITLPETKGKPSDLALKCEYQGKTHQETVSPKKPYTSFQGGNLAASLIATAASAAISASKDEWTYPMPETIQFN